jgi:hypothetical protein
MALPKTFTGGERLFASDLNDNFEYLNNGFEDLDSQLPSANDGQVLTYNSVSGKWEAKDLVMKEKRVAAFTGSGTWTVPSGVTYAVAHMLGGGSGVGSGATGGPGGASSVAFATGTVSAAGAQRCVATLNMISPQAGPANSGLSATYGTGTGGDANFSTSGGNSGARIVAGSTVTPGGTISVTVGAGGTAGSAGEVGPAGVAGGSGYVYIEYYEEV